ncbi:MAG TPA: radical SAM protein, partial [Polyangiaceae bacterium]|nr:radical SAM protein [Polyangiaceae bacterium]
MDVGLVLTRACNLACGYCFAGEKKRARMPLDVGEKAIEFALASASSRGEPLEIELFGGEPLLEWDLLVALATLARER